MSSNTATKKCPRCKRTRTFVPSHHGFAQGREWKKDPATNRWICYLCAARETPGGEEKLRELQAELRQDKKDERKRQKAEKIAPFVWTKRGR